jgi:uncharacterized protein YkwD
LALQAGSSLAKYISMKKLILLLSLVLPITVMANFCEELMPTNDELVLNTEELKFITLMNAYRQAQKPALPPLKVSVTLMRAARWQSNDMYSLGYCDHIDSLKRDAQPRLKAFGYDYKTSWGENVALGFQTAERVFEAWKASPGHNRTMLKPNLKVLGIGKVGDAWTLAVGGVEDELLNY